jgi:tRNA threonylcarbamoyladenosine biosynthesis protein TsaE
VSTRPEHPEAEQPGPENPEAEQLTERPGPAVDERLRVPTAIQMRDLGARLASLLRPGDLVVLSGQLGAGKTTLAQGIGAGLGVRGPVTSPTFVIARVHPSLRGGPDLVHADAYRLGSRAEVDDLDLDANIDSSVTVVEWGEGLVEDLAPSFLEIAIAPAPDSPPSDRPAPDRPAPDRPAPDRPAPDRNALVTPGQPAGEVDEADPDEARTVRVVGWGDRWQDAAEAARQALSGTRSSP